MSKSFTTRLEAGLGELILELLKIDSKKKRGLASEEEKAQHKLFLMALNEITVPIGFDCDGAGIPDSIDIFAKSAKTSCCRILPVEATRRAKARQVKRNASRRR